MPKYGVHAFLLEGSWNNEIAPRVIAQAAELGFDFVEIPLLRPDEFDSALIGSKYSSKELATRGLEFLKENAEKAGLA